MFCFFFFQAEDGIRDVAVTGVQTCALPILLVAELPPEAYGEVMNAFKANPAGAGGVKPESIETSAGLAYYTVENARDATGNVRRYSMILPGSTFSGYVAVQVPENASKIYTDDA